MMHKPVEEVARGYRLNVGVLRVTKAAGLTGPELEDFIRHIARIGISEMRRLNFINDIGLESIKAEEAMKGQGE